MSSLLSRFVYALMEIVVLRCWRDVYFGIRAYEAVGARLTDARCGFINATSILQCAYANDLRPLFRIRYIVQHFSVAYTSHILPVTIPRSLTSLENSSKKRKEE